MLKSKCLAEEKETWIKHKSWSFLAPRASFLEFAAARIFAAAKN